MIVIAVIVVVVAAVVVVVVVLIVIVVLVGPVCNFWCTVFPKYRSVGYMILKHYSTMSHAKNKTKQNKFPGALVQGRAARMSNLNICMWVVREITEALTCH